MEGVSVELGMVNFGSACFSLVSVNRYVGADGLLLSFDGLDQVLVPFPSDEGSIGSGISSIRVFLDDLLAFEIVKTLAVVHGMSCFSASIAC